jgi:Tfp pilus assembly protein FimT
MKRPLSFSLPPSAASRRGLTLFELLGVLTLIGIVLVILLGSYGTWGTAHAVTGAAGIIEAGLQQARTLARTQRIFVGFEYGSVSTNTFQTVSGFQLCLCTNDNAVIASILQQHQDNSPLTDSENELMGITKAAPYQRLSGHIQLEHFSEQHAPTATGVLFFRPDGSAWSWDDRNAHYLHLSSRELFNKAPLRRILRVDLATGFVTVLKEEVTP